MMQVLPKQLAADDNAGGTVCSRSGVPFPPFLVLERGLTLREWNVDDRGAVLSWPELLYR